MNPVARRRLVRIGVFLLGALPVGWRVPVGKAIWTKVVDRESGNRHDARTQFQKQDAVGVFRLGYVNCIPHCGKEQVISIDEDGDVRCVDHAVTSPVNRPARSGKRLGLLRSGTLLKGELEPEQGFVSASGKAARPVTSVKLQVVYLPDSPPGVWLALSATGDRGEIVSWDEIYVRPGFEPKAAGGVA